ncbi:MAG: outer membrane lipoprotein carrier protein LolA [Verrucomicrobiae bacterium]|nr:outer membrane lipoprotein carrier protein LolA [Verrucomicrobiae bacterium]MCP5550260.1 outer membrane lipoprotein carrier protein LolA [Akkermansiaceae bacterium]
MASHFKRKRLPTLAAPLVVWLAALAFSAGAAEPADIAPLEKWLAFHRGLRSLQAEFVEDRTLRTLKRPLRTEGMLWMANSGSRFRWQSGGEPPKTVAVRDGDQLTLLLPAKKLARKIDLSAPASTGGAGQSAAMEFATGGLPRTLKELRAGFSIESLEKSADTWRAELKPRDGRLAGSIDRLVLVIDAGRYYLRGMEMTLRDRSKVVTTFTRQRFNSPVDDALFRPDLSGYSVKSD